MSHPEHYLRPDVQKEIVDFCRRRWVALHYTSSSGNLIFRRYIGSKPIRIERLEDMLKVNNGTLRSIYATANVYRQLQSPENIYRLENIAYCTPTWDIDSELSNWRETIRIAREIICFLNEWGVKRSVYVKWSGNGCHIHINERSISENLLEKYNPLDLAYAIVEYVNTKISLKLTELSLNGKVKIENKMDLTRVFTCPLSFHRELNVVCICMKPEDLDKFTLEWINPQGFRHNPGWREFREGEADSLAEAAYRAMGGYPLKPRRRTRKTRPLDKQIMEWLQKG
ncbi:hypothetical protein KEJ14_00180 [Candidatus Bathyarchaeota archaeon]|nr:hypothetical protein [Candidatus Bathyarchaeota archaeon]